MTEGYSLIFIDVDGVLNSTTENRDEKFIPEIMTRLARLVKDTGATPVLSTAWRLKKESREEVVAQFLEYGLPMPLGCTPRILGPRGNEVLAWLQMNTRNVLQDRELHYGEFREESGEFTEAQYRLPVRIKVAQYVIVDDRDFRTVIHGGMHRELLTDEHFVHIDPRTGMQHADAALVREILCGAGARCERCKERVLHATRHPFDEKLFCDQACMTVYSNKYHC